MSGRVLFPAAGMLEVVRAAGVCLLPHEQSPALLVGDVQIPSPLVLPAKVQTSSRLQEPFHSSFWRFRCAALGHAGHSLLFKQAISIYSALQVNRIPVQCRVDLGQAAKVTLSNSAAATALHLSASFDRARLYASPPQELGSTQSSTWQAVHSSTASGCLAAVQGRPAACSGPLAGMEARNIGGAEYRCHPAVADSSMHIGILAGRPDGQMRIPGELRLS